MAKDECQMYSCEESPESGKYCSKDHEVLHEKRMAEAREAERMDRSEHRSHRSDEDPGMSSSEFRRMVL